MVSPHRPGPWLTDISPNRRSCKLLGFLCVGDFDLSDEVLQPLAWEILDKLLDPEEDYAKGRCDTLNIGLYQGGADIRVWRVWFS